MRSDGFQCKQCGTCCREHTIYLSEDDVFRWTLEAREDILEWVDPIELGDDVVEYDFPIDPDTGDEYEEGCPFLKRLPGTDLHGCTIHDTKPEICANFPLNKGHATKLGCPGYD